MPYISDLKVPEPGAAAGFSALHGGCGHVGHGLHLCGAHDAEATVPGGRKARLRLPGQPAAEVKPYF